MQQRLRRGALAAAGAAVLVAAALGVRVVAARPLVVQVITVHAGELADLVIATGPVEPAEQVQVAAAVSGILAEVSVRAGDAVIAGDRLALVNRTPLEAAVREAAARVAQQEAQIAALRQRTGAGADQRRARLEAAGQRVTLAEAALAAQLEATRRQLAAAEEALSAAVRLLGSTAAPAPEHFDRVAEAERQVQAARADLGRLDGRGDVPAPALVQVSVARAELEDARLAAELAAVQPAEVAAAEAALSAARQSLVRAEADLAGAEIRSPLTGVVLDVRAEAGHGVQAGAPLFTVGILEQAVVAAKVDESEIGRVAPGQPAEVTGAALPGRTLPGRVREVLPAAFKDGSSMVVTTRVEFDNPGLHFRTGMSADVVITALREQVPLAVPLGAVRPGGYVWVALPGGTVERRTVTTGVRAGDQVSVESGLRAAEQVIVGPAGVLDKLRPGDRVAAQEGM